MRRVNLIPMAGAGQRFVDAGYSIPKPLIKVDDLPMVVKAANCLPAADCWIFICREEHIREHGIDDELRKYFPKSEIISVDHLTEGQASTCLLAKDLLREDDQLTIGACDNGMVYNLKAYEKLLIRSDALIWTFRNHPSVLNAPQMYGWVEIDDSGRALRVSCKEPISNKPINDHAVVGAFSFRIASTFFKGVETMIEKKRMINKEYYMDVALDQCINLGFEVYPIEVKQYMCWGTPEDLVDYKNKKYFYENNI